MDADRKPLFVVGSNGDQGELKVWDGTLTFLNKDKQTVAEIGVGENGDGVMKTSDGKGKTNSTTP